MTSVASQDREVEILYIALGWQILPNEGVCVLVKESSLDALAVGATGTYCGVFGIATWSSYQAVFTISPCDFVFILSEMIYITGVSASWH